MNTIDTAPRRTLRFGSFEKIEADIAHLQSAGHDRLGQWSLGMCCAHLAVIPEKAMDGFGFFPTWPLRPFLRRFMLPKMLEQGFSPGMKGPKSFMPPETCDDAEQVQRLLSTHARWAAFTGKLHPSPLFGRLEKAAWAELHFRHAEHHLSFLIPHDRKAD